LKRSGAAIADPTYLKILQIGAGVPAFRRMTPPLGRRRRDSRICFSAVRPDRQL